MRCVLHYLLANQQTGGKNNSFLRTQIDDRIYDSGHDRWQHFSARSIFYLTQFRAVPAPSLYHYSESSPSSISISVSEYSIQINIRQLRCSPADFYLDFHISICQNPLLIPTFPRFPTLTLKAEFSWRILFSNHNILPHPSVRIL